MICQYPETQFADKGLTRRILCFADKQNIYFILKKFKKGEKNHAIKRRKTTGYHG